MYLYIMKAIQNTSKKVQSLLIDLFSNEDKFSISENKSRNTNSTYINVRFENQDGNNEVNFKVRVSDHAGVYNRTIHCGFNMKNIEAPEIDIIVKDGFKLSSITPTYLLSNLKNII